MKEINLQRKRLIFRVLLFLVGLGLPLFAILTGQVIIVGMLLSLALGSFILVSRIKTNSQKADDSKAMKAFAIAFGVFYLLAGVALLIWLFTGAPIPSWEEMRPIFSLEQFIIILGLIGLNFISQFLKKSLDQRMIRRIQKQHPEGRVYSIPTFFTGVMIMVLMLLVPLDLFLIFGGLIGWILKTEGGISLGLGLGLPVLLSPILYFAVGMIRHNSGAVMIDGRVVIRYWYFSKRSIQLDDIQKIKIRGFGFPAGVRLISPDGKIVFPTSINGYLKLFKIIKTYTGLNPHKLANKSTAVNQESVVFPYVIGFSKARWALEVISAGLIVVIYLAMALAGLWILLLRRDAPPFTGEDLLVAGFLFILVSLVFGPFMVMVVQGVFHPKSPTQITFTRDSIRLKYGNRREKNYTAEDLQKAWLQPVKQRARGSYGGARVVSSLQVYDLSLRFRGGDNLVLTRAKLSSWKLTPEALLENLENLYPKI